MSKFFAFLSPFGVGGRGGSSRDDDWVDRLNHKVSVLVFFMFAILVSTKQYVGDQIHCWVPGHFTGNYEEYTNKICWVSNTYYKTFEEDIPKPDKPKKMITYYQWVPLFLMIQALMFYIPCLLWKSLNSKSGVQITQIVQAGKDLNDNESKEKTLRYMVRQMDRYLGHYRDNTHGCFSRMKHYIHKRCPILCGRKYGNFLIALYIATKLLYLTNSIGQLFLVDAFLGSKFYFYGFQILRAMVHDEEWPSSEIFPRVTLCDFKVRQLGNIHRHTVQCVLPINFFNERVYVIIWFWLVIVSTVNIINLILWLISTLLRLDQIQYIRRHLRNMDRMERPEDKKISRQFVSEYLRCDGVLVLKLVAMNTSDLVASELIAELWDYFKSNPPTFYKKLTDAVDV